MELTKSQEITLIVAVKSYRVAKAHFENAQKNLAQKLENLKTACQGTGAEQQVLATAYEHLANSYINKPDLSDLE